MNVKCILKNIGFSIAGAMGIYRLSGQQLSWTGISDGFFLLGTLFMIVALFQITYDLNFYDMAIMGTKRLVAIVKGKEFLIRGQSSENLPFQRNAFFVNKKVHLSFACTYWILSYIIVLV